jgi:CRP/FNR family cyclic AMP-dependent transcriptional regulator
LLDTFRPGRTGARLGSSLTLAHASTAAIWDDRFGDRLRETASAANARTEWPERGLQMSGFGCSILPRRRAKGHGMSLEQTDFRPIARAIGTVMDFSANDFIFREGDPPKYMYVVLKGAVEISTRQKIIETIGEGKALGILSLLDDSPRTFTARAKEPSELALLDKKKFRFMVEEAPNFVWFVMNELGSRLRATNALL